MGIYIEDMEIPKGDNNITLFLYPDRKVVLCGMLGPIGNYEAVPVPKHGRLIDADEALKKIKPIVPEDQQNACTIETTKRLMMNLINNAPTVISAEEDHS